MGMWDVLCFALLLAAVVLFTLLLIRDGMDRDGWGCGVVGEKLYRVRCLVLAVCVCLWNNTAAYKEGSIGKEKRQLRSPHCGVSHFSDVMVKVGSTSLLTELRMREQRLKLATNRFFYTSYYLSIALSITISRH